MSEILAKYNLAVTQYLLRLHHPGEVILWERQQDTVQQDGEDDEEVKELIGGDVQSSDSDGIIRWKQEKCLSGTKSKDDWLLELPGNDYK